MQMSKDINVCSIELCKIPAYILTLNTHFNTYVPNSNYSYVYECL